MLSVASQLSSQSESVLYHRLYGNLLRRTVMISDSDFTAGHINFLCHRLLRNVERSGLVLYDAVTGKHQVNPETPEAHASPQQWLERHQAYSAMRQQFKSAQLIASSRGAVLRIRDQGKVSTSILRGANPLLWIISGQTFEILHIAVNDLPVTNELVGLYIFALTTKIPKIDVTEKLFTALQAEFGVPVLSLSVRTNPWFFHGMFPVYHLYTSDQDPSLEQLLESPEWNCLSLRSGMRCRYSQ